MTRDLRPAAPLRVNFILPYTGKTGGSFVVLEYAQRLAALGHKTAVYHPLFPYRGFFGALPPLRAAWAYAKHLAWSILRSRRGFSWHSGRERSRLVPWISARFLDDADVVVATAWPTAYSVSRFPASKGRKAYFIQGYEIWSGARHAVENSYRLPLNLLTIAPRLTDLLRSRFGREITAEIHNGVDLERFRPFQGDAAPRPLTVLMMHHELELKGMPDGLAVMSRLRAAHPGARFRLFGMSVFPDAEGWMEYFQNPDRDQLVRLYQEADVFLSPSLAEGWHLPPMEAMACGCAVVATRVGCIPVLERDGNLLSAEPGDREGLFRHVDALLRDRDLRVEISRKGLATIREYAWEKKVLEFEGALRRIAEDAGPETPPATPVRNRP